MSLKAKKPPIVQLVDFVAYWERFGSSMVSGLTVNRFEADVRKSELSRGENPPIYVGIVSISRHYGGPEEGGWYYDWYQVEEIMQCQDFRHLLSTVRTLREEYPSCPRGRGSVIGGDDTVVYISRSKKLIEDIQSEERPTWA